MFHAEDRAMVVGPGSRFGNRPFSDSQERGRREGFFFQTTVIIGFAALHLSWVYIA